MVSLVVVDHQPGVDLIARELIAALTEVGVDEISLSRVLNERNDQAQIWVEPISVLALDSLTSLIVLPASSNGNELGSRLAARLRWPFVSSCHVLAEVTTTHAVVERGIYGGNVSSTLEVPTPAVLTLTRRRLESDDFPLPTPIEASPAQQTGNLRLVGFEPNPDAAGPHRRLDSARIVVSGGRGVGDSNNWNLIEELAEAFDGAVGASRMVTDAGWRPNEEQVGQTGVSVSPELYVAIGISGAVQHLAGVSPAAVLVAVNNDPEAPVFKAASYGVVGDLFEFVPELISAVIASRSEENGTAR